MGFNLKESIERIEFLIQERKRINQQITDICNIIKEELDVSRAIINQIIKRRSQNDYERSMEEKQIQALMLSL